MTNLPVDPDAEASLIGSTWGGLLINEPESRTILWGLPPDAFFIADHKLVWSAIQGLLKEGGDVSEHALVWRVGAGRADSQLRAKVAEILVHGADALPGPLADRVRELWCRRIAIAASRSVTDAARQIRVEMKSY